MDLDPDVTELTLGFTQSFDTGGGARVSFSLVVGENNAYFASLDMGITFDDMGRLSGSLLARKTAARGSEILADPMSFFFVGDAVLWTARYGTEFLCPFTCVSTGVWELETIDVPEPGGLPLVLAGLLGVGLLASRSTSLPSSVRSSRT